MRKKYFAIFLLCFIPVFLSQKNAIAYGVKVHAKITDEVFKQTSNTVNKYFNDIGLTNGEEYVNGKTVINWFKDGSESEDEFRSSSVTARYLNHFYDPLTGLGLTGLGVSSHVWASNDGYNAWRWEMARTYFHEGLTKTTKTDREEALSKAFRAIGQVMHLVQDLAVPAHVRDDPHLTVDHYEHWTTINVKDLNYSMVPFQYWNVSISPSAPKQFWDLDSYDGSTVYESGYIGLSEYTNANFFSKDTIFKKKYPHPSYDDTNWTNIDLLHPEKIDAEDGKKDSRIYIKKIAGDTGYSLAARSYVSYDCIKKGYYQFEPWVLDDKIHKEYASRLVPRAVGYSAGLLNYFFRGTLEISNPDGCLYSIIDGSELPQQFTTIKAKVKNTTPNEAMQAGTLQAVIRYKKRADYQPDLSADDPLIPASRDEYFSYSVSEPVTLTAGDITSLNGTTPKEFTFDFKNSPIPAGITDLYLQVIFKGTLGNEADIAIAVGMKDLSEPMHHVNMNWTDRFYLDGVPMTAEDIKNDPTLYARASASGRPIDPYPLKTEISFCPVAGHAPTVIYDAMPAGSFGRVITIVGADQTEFPLVVHRISITPPDEKTTNFTSPNIVNQDFKGVFNPAAVYTIRGVKNHGGSAYENYYPYDTGVLEAPWPDMLDLNPIAVTKINP